MVRRLYLHIGTMKSGTTYLQKLLDANRHALDEAGLLWLPSWMNHAAINDFARSTRSMPAAAGAWAQFRRTVRQHQGDVLFSSELMCPFRQPKVRRLVTALQPNETRVIITARDLTKVVPSHWQETTQNHGTMPWREWVDRVCKGPEERDRSFRFWAYQDLPGLIDNWSVAAPGQVYLVTVPKSRTDPELMWRRFASALELELPKVKQPSSVNPSLGAVSGELMRRINVETADLPFPRYSPGFKFELAKRVLVHRARQEPRPALTTDDYARLREIAVEMLDEVGRRDVTVVGDMADLVPAGTNDEEAFDPAEIGDAELLQAAIAGLKGLGLRVSSQQQELKRLRAQLGAVVREGAPSPVPREAPPPRLTDWISSQRSRIRVGAKRRTQRLLVRIRR